MIIYTHSLNQITPDQLHGFFVGWPNPPSPQTHLRILQNSSEILLAIDDETGNVVGFITAISDNVLAAFIPNLEVLPAYKGQGIGTELVQRMLAKLENLYAVDLICDEDVQPFYERLGMQRYSGMVLRNFKRQSGDDVNS